MNARRVVTVLATLLLAPGIALAAQRDDPSLPAVVFLGDSLTAGYGLGADEAYPALVARRIAERGLPFSVVNAGVSGDTTAGGASRIDWLLRRPMAVLVVALGANDGLRGLPLAQSEEFLDRILHRTRESRPDADLVVVGMLMPPNLGPEYTAEFRELFPRVAARHKATLLPFLLEGVGGVPDLNQADGIHPTAEGQRKVAETVWAALEPILERRAAGLDAQSNR
ncbi:MAG TPA: arylesterase [Thermoanaerobaculia bacterium]|nr:arylesterase [Thermoanaerobaculia bacterium]